jgi:hypothetical protein
MKDGSKCVKLFERNGLILGLFIYMRMWAVEMNMNTAKERPHY